MKLNGKLGKYPAIRLLLPFVLGIFATNQFNLHIPYIGIIALLLFMAVAFTTFRPNKLQSVPYFGISVSLFFVSLAVFLTEQKKPNPTVLAGYTTHSIKIVSVPQIREKTIRAEAQMELAKTDSGYFNETGKVLCYFERDHLAETLKFGDKLFVHTKFEPVRNNGNPYEFDYETYLQRKGLTHTAYIEQYRWQAYAQGNYLHPIYLANKARNSLLHIYRQNNLKGDQMAVASALTLGYKAELDTSLKKNYAVSGVMHILAVSGLHIGVILLVLQRVIRINRNSSQQRFVKFLLITSALWAFAFITGLSPSVVRAATMFSFLQGAYLAKRPSDVYNTLTWSALLLLMLSPNKLYEVGFQLSYLAVFSIVWLQPKIYNLLTAPDMVTDKLWQLLSVSLAAQLGTTPISIHYFGVFPSYFWLSNLFAVPLASILIYIALVLFLSMPFGGIVSSTIAYVFGKTIWLLNYLVGLIANLPHAAFQNIYLPTLATYSLYFWLLFGILFLTHRHLKWLYLFLSISIIGFGNMQWYRFEKQGKQQLVVFNIRNTSATAIANHKALLILTNTTPDSSQLMYSLTGFIKKNNFTEVKYQPTAKPQNITHKQHLGGPYWLYGNQIMVLLNKTHWLDAVPKQAMPIDFMVLSGDIYSDADAILSIYHPKQIIIDATNSKKQRKQWRNDFMEQGILVHDVVEQGAFTHEIDK